LLYEVFGQENVGVGAHLQRTQAGLRCGSKEDKLSLEAGVAEIPQEIEAGHVGHFRFGNDEIEYRTIQLLEALLRARNASHIVAFFFEEFFRAAGAPTAEN